MIVRQEILKNSVIKEEFEKFATKAMSTVGGKLYTEPNRFNKKADQYSYCYHGHTFYPDGTFQAFTSVVRAKKKFDYRLWGLFSEFCLKVDHLI